MCRKPSPYDLSSGRHMRKLPELKVRPRSDNPYDLSASNTGVPRKPKPPRKPKMTPIELVKEGGDVAKTVKRECHGKMIEAMHPDKMDAHEFVQELKTNLKAFEDNMNHLKMEDRYAEEWMKLFVKWMEMH